MVSSPPTRIVPSTDAHPPAVDFQCVVEAILVFWGNFLVIAGVEKPYDRAVDLQTPRNPDRFPKRSPTPSRLGLSSHCRSHHTERSQ